MKIFGAVLIVSGGFFIGKIWVSKWSLRLKVLTEITELFRSFDTELRELRRSPEDVLRGKGELAERILNHQPIKGLNQQDSEQLEGHIGRLRADSFQEAVAANRDYVAQLDKTVEKLQQDEASAGKAFPLVTGAIGVIIAVMLF